FRKGDPCFGDIGRLDRSGVEHVNIHVQAGHLAAQQFAELAELALVVGGEDELGCHQPARVSRWISASWVVPISARSRRRLSSSRSNGAPSAVPCTSTNLPEPVTTTFMSVSARTSST